MTRLSNEVRRSEELPRPKKRRCCSPQLRPAALRCRMVRECYGPGLAGRPGFGRHRPSMFHPIDRAPRPGPSPLQRMGRGPADPIAISKINGSARPGPFHLQICRDRLARSATLAARHMKHEPYMRMPATYVCWPTDLTGRDPGRLCPTRKGEGVTYVRTFHVMGLFSFFVLLDSVGQPMHHTYIPTTHTISPQQRPAPMASVPTGGPPPLLPADTMPAAAAGVTAADAEATAFAAARPPSIDLLSKGSKDEASDRLARVSNAAAAAVLITGS